MTQKTDVNLIDPDFALSLQTLTASYVHKQREADITKWQIAQKVNEMYPEHHGIFSGDKMAYYAECTRVANLKLEINIFGESGQTLRRWCEVAAAYENVWQSKDFLEMLSFRHLEVAKKLLKDGKIKGLDFALAKSVDMKWSADDLREAYDPPTSPTEYDKWAGAITVLLDIKNYEWIQSAQVKEQIFTRVKEIEMLKADYLKEKGLHE